LVKSHYDIVVVGGAVHGSSAAWWLLGADSALDVLVVEPDPTYQKSATALSVASVRCQFSNPVNVEISRFGVDFIRDFQGHIPDGGVPSLGLRENGYLFLGSSRESAALMEDLAQMQRRFGASTRVLARAELAARFPWMNLDDVEAGSLGEKDEGWFDNMGMLSGFRTGAIQRGATYLKDRARSLLSSEGRIAGVDLEGQGIVSADLVLVAAGTGTTALLRTLDLAWPVEPRKRTVFFVDAPNARHPDAPLIIDHTGVYLRPEHGSWITATVPQDDRACAPDDWEPDHMQFEDTIWPLLYQRSAGFDAVKVQRSWVGHYDYNTLDQNAILGPHPGCRGLYVASGFSGHGLQQAPAVGRGLSEIMLTGSWQTIDLSQLGVGRVLDGRPFLEQAVV
jgi:glycine/D-amino acid oxidase-like deaminating enzyme